MIDTETVNRFEVIDHTKSVEEGGGRVLTAHDVQVDVSLQDDGRTLKVFINKPV